MHVPDLSTDLEYLEALDSLRNRAKRLRDSGLKALARFGNPADQAYWQQDDQSAVARTLVHRSKQIAYSLGNSPEPSETLKPLPEVVPSSKSACRSQEECFSLEDEDTSVFLAAEYFRAELDAAGGNLSDSFFVCMYWVVRELYTFDSPDCPFGGARADKYDGQASAFVTQECARALGYLAKKLDRTAEFLSLTDQALQYAVYAVVFNQRQGYLREEWCQSELRREKLNLESLAEAHAGRILLGLKGDHLKKDVEQFGEAMKELTRSFLGGTVAAIRRAKGKCESFRTDEKGLEGLKVEDQERKRHHDNLSESAHLNALDALTSFASVLEKIAQANDQEILREAGARFREISSAVKRLLEPVRLYMRETLYAAMFEAEAGRSVKRLRDIALVVAPLGRMEGTWTDPIYERALKLLVGSVSEYGELPLGDAFKQNEEGYQRLTVNAHALRALAELIQQIPLPVETGLVELMVRFFERWKVEIGREELIGWCREGFPGKGKASVWVSCVSINALNRIVRMLDAKINNRLAAHFTVEFPEDLRGVPKIQDLMCTDVGLACCDWKSVNRERILLTEDLENMRAHLIRHPLRKDIPTTCSIILYGPPGTGKTTNIESLAVTSGVPLIRVTPSDFLIGGEEKVEVRGKAVMRALSMSTRVVILFDEFDPVLADRKHSDHPSSVFSFLTGAMLPRLTSLNQAAKRNRFVYALATNYLDRLDVAAIRPGRFDEKRGVYPPDAASRICRLVSQLVQWRSRGNQDERVVPFESNEFWRKLALVVAKTASLPTVQLMRKGWFRQIDGEIDVGKTKKVERELESPLKPTPWSYLLNADKKFEDHVEIWWPMPGDLGLSPKGSREEGIRTLVELDQAAELRMVWLWDSQINRMTDRQTQITRQELLDATWTNPKRVKVMKWWEGELDKLRKSRLNQAKGDMDLPETSLDAK